MVILQEYKPTHQIGLIVLRRFEGLSYGWNNLYEPRYIDIKRK